MGEDIVKVIQYWMEGEIFTFIQVWLSVYISLCYCYIIAKIVPKGVLRLFAFLPVVCLFLFLPLNLHKVHLIGITSFFVSWLANFKLLMLAFDRGPLSDPSISLFRFLPIACLPIKLQQRPIQDKHNPSQNLQFCNNPPDQMLQNGQKSVQDKHNPSQILQCCQHPSDQISQNGQISAQEEHKPSQNEKFYKNSSGQKPQKGHQSIISYATKGLLLALFIKVYDYSEHVHPSLILVIYSLHIYFCLELMLVIAAALARALLGLELEPQFNEPYLSTSLQDFWGRRWNLMVTRILHPTVYDPVLWAFTKLLGRKWAPLPAVLGTFVVSGVIHELIFYYLGRIKPTWEITSFFLLHGVCLMVEIAIKKVVSGRWRLPRIVASVLTVGFLIVTGFWLFFPPLLRMKADDRAFEEYAAIGAFTRDLIRALHI